MIGGRGNARRSDRQVQISAGRRGGRTDLIQVDPWLGHTVPSSGVHDKYPGQLVCTGSRAGIENFAVHCRAAGPTVDAASWEHEQVCSGEAVRGAPVAR
jgi:hypothetical protein